MVWARPAISPCYKAALPATTSGRTASTWSRRCATSSPINDWSDIPPPRSIVRAKREGHLVKIPKPTLVIDSGKTAAATPSRRKTLPGSRPIIIFAPAKLAPPFVAKLDIRLERFHGPRGLQGYSAGGVIFLRRRLPGRERAATLAHELAHEILHDMRSRSEMVHRQREPEADATSCAVQRALGPPSRAPASLAWHGGDGKLVPQSLKRVQRAARRVLRAYESLMARE
jgi:hypothetical protein